MMFRIFALLLAALVIAQPARAELTEAQVKNIVRDYIRNNPQDLLDSLSEYQQNVMKARQSDALDKNRNDIFRDDFSPELGNAKGDVTIVEFMDYNCHFCKLSWPILREIMDQDKNVRVILKDFPVLGPSSIEASRWALAAQKQGKYLGFHKAMMDHQGPIEDASLEAAAKAAGMDIAKARTDKEGADVEAQLAKNQKLGIQLGLSGTPVFIIGDEIVSGAMTLPDMQAKIASVRAGKKKK